MNAASLNNLWGYLQGLSLTANNQRWLAEKLTKSAQLNDIQVDETDVIEKIEDDITPYTIEELNARIDEAEAEIDRGEGKSFDEMMNGFRKEMQWLK
ncbi:MAG: hypothetical protein IKZ99_03880 [Salinivirgaceae bacterium]|nr:hypothetical protein [Salinivirgaceae bacterium]